MMSKPSIIANKNTLHERHKKQQNKTRTKAHCFIVPETKNCTRLYRNAVISFRRSHKVLTRGAALRSTTVHHLQSNDVVIN